MPGFFYLIEIVIPVVTGFIGFGCGAEYISAFSWGQKHLLQIEKWAGYISVIWIVFVLGIHGLLIQKRNAKLNMQIQQSILWHKEMFITALEQKIKNLPDKIQIRIFVNERWWQKLYIFLRYKQPWNSKRIIIKNIPGFAEKGTKEGLFFQVHPVAQGLVGRCYREKKWQFDQDLRKSTEDYQLCDFQKSKVRDLSFCSCVPIINPGNRVEAIIAFDSVKAANLSPKDIEIWEEAANNYANIMHDIMPSLFK